MAIAPNKQSWMPSDVYFGTADPTANANDVDWRKEATLTDEDDDAPPTKADLESVKAVLGFDPSDIDWEESTVSLPVSAGAPLVSEEGGQTNRPFAADRALGAVDPLLNVFCPTGKGGSVVNASNPAADMLDIWEDANAWWWDELMGQLKAKALSFLQGDYYGQPGIVEEGRDRLDGFDDFLLDLDRVIAGGLADPDVEDGALDMLVDAYLDGVEMAYRDAGPEGADKAQVREFVYGLVGNANATTNATPPRDVWGQFMSAKAKEMSDRLAAGWKVQAGAVSQGIAAVVTKGIAAGKTDEQISADIREFSTGVPRARADVIARTEVTRAAAEGQLAAYGRLGVSELVADISFELRTQGKNSCPDCVALEKLGPMPIEKARGLIPVHPGCKCRWRVIRSVVGVRNDGINRIADLFYPRSAVTGSVVNVANVVNVFCPTGKGGGIDPTCGRGGITRAQSAAALQKANHIIRHLEGKTLNIDQALALTKQMGKLTVAQLRQLKTEHGVKKVGGNKEQLAAQIAMRLMQQAEARRSSQPKPVPPDPTPRPEPVKPVPQFAKLPHPELDPNRPGIMAGTKRDSHGLAYTEAKALRDNYALMSGKWVMATDLHASGVLQTKLDYMLGNHDMERSEVGGQVFYRISPTGSGTIKSAARNSSPGPQEFKAPRTRKELADLEARYETLNTAERTVISHHFGVPLDPKGWPLPANQFRNEVEGRISANLNSVPIGERLKNSPHEAARQRIAALADTVEKDQIRRSELMKKEGKLAIEATKALKKAKELPPGSPKRDALYDKGNALKKESDRLRAERQAIATEADAVKAAHALIHQELNKPGSYKVDTTALPTPTGGLPGIAGTTPVRTVETARQFLDGKIAPQPGDAPMEPVKGVYVGPPGTRAVYYNGTRTIEMDNYESSAVVVHEYGHHVEYQTPGSRTAAQEFLKHRRKGEDLELLQNVCPTCGYKPDEKGIKDDFHKAFGEQAYYVGKHYDHGATEIVSMGVQKMYQDPVKFAKNDPEYFNFVMGILSGEHRNKTLPEG